jgi:predicted TIM-barrel fold metal-dependent hydrolase
MTTARPVLFDSHAHLVADDEVRYPRNPLQPGPNSPQRLPGTVGKPGGHHGPHPIHEVPDTRRLLRWMQEENVQGAVAVQKRMIYRYDNSYILDSSDAHPDDLSPVVILDAQDDATPGLLRDWTQRHRLSGVRLFGYRLPDGTADWLNSPKALRTWDAARELGIVVDLEVICKEGSALAIPTVLDIARRYADVPIVLDHLLEPHVTDEGYGLEPHRAQLAGMPNLFYKFTSINLDILRESGVDTAAFLRRAVDIFGADRIMWGSDIGTSSGTYKDMVERMIDAARLLTPEEQRAVYNETGRRVFIAGGAKNDPTRRGARAQALA